MKTSYEVNEANKTIVVNMKRVSDKQLDIIQKYLKLGYKLVEYKPTKNNDYTAETIAEVLENRTELKDLFDSICKELVYDKETGKTKKKKKDSEELKTKGHIAGVKWYKQNIENGNDLNEMKKEGTLKAYLDSLDIEKLSADIDARRKAEKEKIEELRKSLKK